jgi:hypothetical protein
MAAQSSSRSNLPILCAGVQRGVDFRPFQIIRENSRIYWLHAIGVLFNPYYNASSSSRSNGSIFAQSPFFV